MKSFPSFSISPSLSHKEPLVFPLPFYCHPCCFYGTFHLNPSKLDVSLSKSICLISNPYSLLKHWIVEGSRVMLTTLRKGEGLENRGVAFARRMRLLCPVYRTCMPLKINPNFSICSYYCFCFCFCFPPADSFEHGHHDKHWGNKNE